MIKNKSYFFIISLFALSLLFLTITLVLAQSQDTPWSPPTNLSRSGAATDPYIIVDSSGSTHVIWVDEYDGLTYVQKTGDKWSKPGEVDLPFSNGFTKLKFIADEQGYIHAVWIDDEDVLYYSRVRGEWFGSPSAWSGRQVIALSVADMELTAAQDGRSHLIYVRNESASDFPSGVYSMSLAPGSSSWTNPRLIYASDYFRGLMSEQPLVGISSGENRSVYAVWHDPAEERIYLVSSSDNGRSWGEPIEIDHRLETDGFGAIGPSAPKIFAQNQNSLLMWYAGHEGASCSIYFIFTDDDGVTWSEPGLLPEPFQRTCPQSLQLLVDENDDLWLLATTTSGIYLLSWDPTSTNGIHWSNPQLQSEISGFSNPETYRPVSLSCQRGALSGNELQIVGCEVSGNELGAGRGDIWYLERPLGNHRAYFPTPTPTSLWSTSVPINVSENFVTESTMIADDNGRLHAFWSIQDNANIYYALWDGERWSRPINVLTSPGGTPLDLSVALHPSGNLFLSWSDPSAGDIFTSSVPLVDAINPGEWRVPQVLPINGSIGISTQVQVDDDGVIYIAYAIPVNEGRGVYVQQTDGPADLSELLFWNAPDLVFDAAKSGWVIVGGTRFTLDANGNQHLLWTRYTLPPSSQPLALYYSRSLSEETLLESEQIPENTTPSPEQLLTTSSTPNPAYSVWSPIQEVDRGAIIWSQIISAPDGTLHRAWQQELANDLILWHNYSLDGGVTWSEPARITGFRSGNGPASLALDISGNLYLLQISSNFQGDMFMQRWQWEGGENWSPAESQSLHDLVAAYNLNFLSTSSNELAALYTAQINPTELAEAREINNPITELLFSIRSAEENSVNPTSKATLVSTPGELQIETIPIPSSTPELNLSTEPPNSLTRIFPLISNRWIGLVFGAIPATLIVIVVFIWVARRLLAKRC